MTLKISQTCVQEAVKKHRTFIKICGLTCSADVEVAVEAGADAIGFVLYAKSPRAVKLDQAKALADLLPPHVMPILLLVNPEMSFVSQVSAAIPHATFQFHGDESPSQCQQFANGHDYWAVGKIAQKTAAALTFDLVEYALSFHRAGASALLLDTLVDGYGGGGKTFDWNLFNWSQFSTNVKIPLVLSGGLTPANVADGIRLVKPWAVDVSSGVEHAKGIKDRQKIVDFIQAVRACD